MTIIYLLTVLLTCSLPDDDQSFPTDVGINLAALERLKVRAGQSDSLSGSKVGSV